MPERIDVGLIAVCEGDDAVFAIDSGAAARICAIVECERIIAPEQVFLQRYPLRFDACPLVRARLRRGGPSLDDARMMVCLLYTSDAADD